LNLHATYRLQLNKDLTFSDVEEILDYLVELGVSHLYLSPVFQARPGSPHGYDVIDYRINSELGGEDGYRRLIARARAKGLGIIQDIVPNHMAIHEGNYRLMDVLKKGRASRYYRFFDFYEEEDKIRIPILEDKLENLIAQGLIRLEKDVDGEYYIKYRDWRFPLNTVGKDLVETLNMQHYILAHWRDPPSYRRFLAVNELIAINEEYEEVFEEAHREILKYDVDGYRVDHVDGLFNPIDYVRKLKRVSGGRIVLVEKILAFGEKLFEGPDGTTGYDFLNYSNLLFTSNEEKMTSIYESFIQRRFDLDQELRSCKEKVLRDLFPYEVERYSRLLGIKAEDLRDYLICLNIYRTYGDVKVECDRSGAIARAYKSNPHTYHKLEQFMPAVYVKAYEDMLLFRYNRLISLNEVGSDLHYYSLSYDDFHEFNAKRVGTLSLNATSTHDTKFSEDVRMKISAISEYPDEWREKVYEWHDILNPKVDRNDEYRFYQVLIGSYFREGFSEEYRRRIEQHMIKSLREASIYTSWLNPNIEYERRMLDLVEEAFTNRSFINSFSKFEAKIRRVGMEKSLSLVALKIMSPGVPDIYQGTETWRYLLTDPDNRRPVNFEELADLLKRSRSFDKEMISNMDDGRIKIYITHRLLRLRRDLNINSLAYKPMRTPDGVCGFWRGDRVLVLVKTRGIGRVVVRVEGRFIDYLTGEYVVNDVEIDSLPRILIREK